MPRIYTMEHGNASIGAKISSPTRISHPPANARGLLAGERYYRLRLAKLPRASTLRILLYNPDNGVTQNFMPHLWMFLLQALTPSGHEVTADRRQYTADERCRTGSVRTGSKNRTGRNRRHDPHDRQSVPRGGCVARGRRTGRHGWTARDRSAGRSALGRDGGPRHADALALGKPTKPGRASSRMPRAANSKRLTLRWTRSARSASRIWPIIRRSLGLDRPEAVQPDSRLSAPGDAALQCRLGDVSHYPDRIRTRLPVWVRVLHGDGFLRRLDPLPLEPEHRR
jgi:hypothetical protein